MSDKEKDKSSADCNKETENQEVKNKETSEKHENEQPNLQDELRKLQSDFDKQKDMFLRTAAEYENFRKRSEKEKLSIYTNATAATIEIILPVVDSLEFAIKAQDGATEEYQKGLQLIKNQLVTAFEKLGVKPLGSEGDEFDPNFHNAVSHIEDESIAENTIIEVFQKGYIIGDKVIRHAMVKVAN